MSATLAKQFQDYAARCLELARAARTTAGRARFMQMAREYQSAASLIHKELSADLRSGGVARLGRGAEQPSNTRLVSPALLKQAGIALPLWPIAPDWLKFKNPNAPAVKREAEEDWGRTR